ncbi:aminoacyl-tRNA hydrolase [Niallia sp. Krafla_26]|uniref:aminoacyl-tRNA hydrolase n=1 Tax=Niallia sp. Krafla_26 TaxID=3064703 RepID=UPI003D183FA1
MKLIVGLGNPGKQYEHTRHNIGFEVVDALAEKLDISLDQAKFKGIFGYRTIEGEKVFLLKPLTYMNLSGESISALMNYYQMDVEDLVVIYDDLDLPVGKIRLRQKGSAGGHNGIKSIISHLGTSDFNRIRVGINRPSNGMPIVDYVLGRFQQEEMEQVQIAVVKSVDACEEWIKKPFIQVMNIYN